MFALDNGMMPSLPCDFPNLWTIPIFMYYRHFKTKTRYCKLSETFISIKYFHWIMHIIIWFFKKNSVRWNYWHFWAGFNSWSSLTINMLVKEVNVIPPCLPFSATETSSISIFAGGWGAIVLLNWYFHFGISGHTKGEAAEICPERGMACIQ